MKRRNVTLMVVGNFFCIIRTRRVAARCDEIVGLPPDYISFGPDHGPDVRRVESLRYIPDPSLKRQTLTSKQGLLSPLLENLPSTQIS